MPRHIRDAVREGVIAERFGWDLNTIDAAPDWWLAVNLTAWSVHEDLAEERRKAASKGASKGATPRGRRK